jgi:hypothetical protein
MAQKLRNTMLYLSSQKWKGKEAFKNKVSWKFWFHKCQTRIQMFSIFSKYSHCNIASTHLLRTVYFYFHVSNTPKFYRAAFLLHKIEGCPQTSNQKTYVQKLQSPIIFIKFLHGPFSEWHLRVDYTRMYYFNVRCPNQEWIMDRPSIFLHTHQTNWDICPSNTHVSSYTQEVSAQRLQPLTHLSCHLITSKSVFLQNASAMIYRGGHHYVQVLG